MVGRQSSHLESGLTGSNYHIGKTNLQRVFISNLYNDFYKDPLYFGFPEVYANVFDKAESNKTTTEARMAKCWRERECTPLNILCSTYAAQGHGCAMKTYN